MVVGQSSSWHQYMLPATTIVLFCNNEHRSTLAGIKREGNERDAFTHQ
jgi:hypothetical protein